MSSAASAPSAALGAALLAARDGRQALLSWACREARARGHATVGILATNVPGARKPRAGLSRLLASAWEAWRGDLEPLASGHDRLGPYRIASSPRSPEAVKIAALRVEAEHSAGRLLDLDVLGADGSPLGRVRLGHPHRPCLACGASAWDCIRLGRHTPEELDARVEALLAPFGPGALRLEPRRLAQALVQGARMELALTPKPGLVDQADCGSHPDLSYARMEASIVLMPRYFERLLVLAGEGAPLSAAAAAGREAEARMVSCVGSNAHRGFLFLSGLLLLAAHRAEGRASRLPACVSALAAHFFREAAPSGTHGADLRARLGMGGIQAEAEDGLPSVFDGGWPRLTEARDRGWPPERAAFGALAELMQRVDDTTAVRRAGPEGLARIRRDGARLEACTAAGLDPVPLLRSLNVAYRELNLTMGGVADCLALSFALQLAAEA